MSEELVTDAERVQAWQALDLVVAHDDFWRYTGNDVLVGIADDAIPRLVDALVEIGWGPLRGSSSTGDDDGN